MEAAQIPKCTSCHHCCSTISEQTLWSIYHCWCHYPIAITLCNQHLLKTTSCRNWLFVWCGAPYSFSVQHHFHNPKSPLSNNLSDVMWVLTTNKNPSSITMICLAYLNIYVTRITVILPSQWHHSAHYKTLYHDREFEAVILRLKKSNIIYMIKSTLTSCLSTDKWFIFIVRYLHFWLSCFLF